MAQQTAVEWFFDKLKNHEIQSEHFELYQQAKQMEKEQHYYSCVNVIEGVLNKVEKGEKTNSRDVFDQYYTKTYGK